MSFGQCDLVGNSLAGPAVEMKVAFLNTAKKGTLPALEGFAELIHG